MATALGDFSRKMGRFESQVWSRISKLVRGKTTIGLAGLVALVEQVGDSKVSFHLLQTRIAELSELEREELGKAGLLQEKPPEVPKPETSASGRSGRSSSEEEKQIILSQAEERGLQHKPEMLFEILTDPNGRNMAVTLRSVRMILKHKFGSKAQDGEE